MKLGGACVRHVEPLLISIENIEGVEKVYVQDFLSAKPEKHKILPPLLCRKLPKT